MDPELVSRIANNPNYQELKAKRTRFGWWLTAGDDGRLLRLHPAGGVQQAFLSQQDSARA